MNWLDLGIVLFIIILIFIGIKQGFMISLLSNFSLAINSLISFFLCKPIKWIINHIFQIGKLISNNFYTSLIEKSADFSVNLIELSTDQLHSTVNNALNSGDFNFFSKLMFKIFLNKNNLYETLHTSSYSSRTLAEIISQTYASFYTTIIAFVTALILLFIAVKCFEFLANKLRTIGFVKVVDNSLGALYGVFRCFIILVIICCVIKLLSPFAFMESIISYINGSFFGRFIYNQINEFINNYLSFSDIIASIFK